ncbi:uncharacterized protein LOC141833356 [Curcuma longa]|uniref:uncharacterized protein LOC141833356 n=1 Tax=Curcuma longa TaxID=136217 RepID=UPI003D9E5DD6
MGQINYPPAQVRTEAREPTTMFSGRFKARGYNHQPWTLPSAQTNDGAILILPEDIGQYSEVISRWESITNNLVNQKTWLDNAQKVQFIENLLGETEKKMWIQWRMAYVAEYEALVQMAGETQNVLSAIRRSILLDDPYQGSTVEQDQAFIYIEWLSCSNMKDIFNYLNDFKFLPAKTGRAFISPELSDKIFKKMPPLIGQEIVAAFKKRYPANQVGILPRIHFTYQYLADICKKVAVQKVVKDLTFCSKIPIPGYYNKQKKYGLRKSRTYKGKPHDSHIRVFKRKKGDQQKKCKCFICGEPGHFARDCKRKTGNIARAAVMDQLDLPSDYDVLSIDLNENDSDAICSFSEGETGPNYVNVALDDTPWA